MSGLHEEIEFRFNERLDQRRKVLVDTFEGLFGHQENWPYLRKLLLRFCGDSGVRGDLKEVLIDLRLVGNGKR